MPGAALRSWCVWWIACCSILPSAFGLDPSKALNQYVFDHWGAERGLFGGEVNAIAQSGDGYLWIGTTRGLVRFDGSSFQLIQQPVPGLPPAGPVRGMVSDGEGAVWIRYDGARLLRYRNGVFDDALVRFNLPQLVVTAMSPDGTGGVLFSELGNLLYSFRNNQIQPMPAAKDVPGTVTSIAQTLDRTIWLGTREDGLFRLRDGELSLVTDRPEERSVNVLLPSPNGGLWIGTDHGLALRDEKSTLHDAYKASLGRLQILSMTQDIDDSTWLGTDKGLVRITAAGQVAFSDPNEDQITTICTDQDRSLWFGGPHGLERLRDGTFTSYTTSQGLLANKNGPIWIDASGRTWAAPLSGGLYWFKGPAVEQVRAAGLDRDVVYSIAGDGSALWLGRQRGGLTALEENGGSFIARTYRQSDGLAQDSVFTVKVASDHSVWAGTVSGGISRLKDGRFATWTTADGLSSNTVVSIAEDRRATVWAATPNGLDAFQGGRWTERGVQDGLPSADIRTIFEDREGVLWIATAEGLAYLNGGRLHVPGHLPDSLREPVTGLAEDATEDIWLTTPDQVVEVGRDKLLDDTVTESDVRSFGLDDGLPGVKGVGRERSVVNDGAHQVWMSLDGGIAMTGGRVTLQDASPAVARIDAVRVDRVIRTPAQNLRIGPDTNSITFVFSVTSLANLDRFRFRYKLDGYDKGWSDPTNIRQVTYTNLGPRSYRFQVIASNAAGLWNGPVTTLAFTRQPAYWQTSWFQVLLAVLGVLLLTAAYRLRTIRMVRTMNLRFEERMAERARIARELHDTLLQSFNGLLLRFQAVSNLLPARPEEARERIDDAIELAASAITEGRDAVYELRSGGLATTDLAQALSNFAHELLTQPTRGTAPEFDARVEGTPADLNPVVRDEVYRIAAEALRNAVRHADARRIEVEIRYDSEQLRLRVRDDGKGIDPNVMDRGQAPGHWGLRGMRERARLVGGNFEVWSELRSGTEVELSIPAARAYATSTNRRKFDLSRILRS
jgi:signal transduction histidine kinase/ligand-binding sensor domain-containing protein